MHHFWHFLWAWGGTALAVMVGVWAFWRGGPVEKYGAAILLTGWFLTPLVQTHGPNGPGVGIGYLLVDWAGAIAFVILSIWSRRPWTLFAAAFQVNSVASHYAGALALHAGVYSMITILGFWGGYGIVFALAAGVWGYQKRNRAQAKAS